ncbi:MAG: hypothetical protein QXK88_04300 [Desulfurococcaceae archaeon]
MIGLLVTVDVIGFAYLYILIAKLTKRTRFYKEMTRMIEQATRIPEKISSKADIRRARKYQPYAKALRRKTLIYILINVGGFIAIYSLILFTTTALVNSIPEPLVKSPVFIPLYGKYDAEMNTAYVHAYIVELVAFALVIYPISKEIKPEMMGAKNLRAQTN